MKRIAHASLLTLMIAVCSATATGGPATKPDAQTILNRAAQAVARAESVHIVGYHYLRRGPAGEGETDGKILKNKRKEANCFETWSGHWSLYSQLVDPDGKVTQASGFNLSSGRWWDYKGEDQILHVADLKPFAPRLLGPLSQGQEGGYCYDLLDHFGVKSTDATKRVAFLTRGGRSVAVITVVVPFISLREVVEVDADTGRLLSLRFYGKDDNKAEQLVIATRKVEWDVPVPAHLRTPRLARGTKIIRTTAVMWEETDRGLTLCMTSKQESTCDLDTISFLKR